MDELYGTHQIAIHFRGNGALQEVDRDYETVDTALTDEDSFEIGERSGLHTHSLSDAEKGVRLAWRTRTDYGLDGFHFGGGNGGWLHSETDNIFDVGGGKHGKTIIPAQLTKQIAWKQGRGETLAPIGVLARFQICGAEDFESPANECVSHGFFSAGTDLQREPMKASFRTGYRHFCHKTHVRFALRRQN